MRFGDYDLLAEIGAGSAGVVYRALQRSLDRVVALKMLRPGSALSSTDVQRFRAEAEAVARLDHPHIVPVYEAGECEGRLFYTMKLIDGADLAASVAGLRHKPERVAEVMAEVASAVHHAHERGVLHRDIKPANILPDGAGEPHLLDFGLARPLDGNLSLTTTGVIVGSPAYMSPEQARGAKDLEPAADVYSLGAVLYELLTGRPPFQAATAYQTLQAVRQAPPILPRTLNRKVNRDLEAVCLKCLEKEPARRYAAAAALAEDLLRVRQGQPVVAPRPSALPVFWRRLRRRVFWPVAAAAVTLLVAGAWALTLPSDPEPQIGDESKVHFVGADELQRMYEEGNYGRFLEIMGRPQVHRRLAPESPAWARLQKQYEHLRGLPLLCTLEVPANNLGIPRGWSPGWSPPNREVLERVVAPFKWSPDGRQIVSEWGTVHDPVTGTPLDTTWPGKTFVESLLPSDFLLLRIRDLQKTGAAYRSPDGTKLMTSSIPASPYWNVWDATRLE
jgi:hypothetical protein